MTLNEVVAYVGLSERFVYGEARSGRLPAVKIARTYRFYLADVDAWLDSYRVSGPSGSS